MGLLSLNATLRLIHVLCDFLPEVIEEIRYSFDVLKANGVSITSSYGEAQNAGESGALGIRMLINVAHSSSQYT